MKILTTMEYRITPGDLVYLGEEYDKIKVYGKEIPSAALWSILTAARIMTSYVPRVTSGHHADQAVKRMGDWREHAANVIPKMKEMTIWYPTVDGMAHLVDLRTSNLRRDMKYHFGTNVTCKVFDSVHEVYGSAELWLSNGNALSGAEIYLTPGSALNESGKFPEKRWIMYDDIRDLLGQDCWVAHVPIPEVITAEFVGELYCQYKIIVICPTKGVTLYFETYEALHRELLEVKRKDRSITEFILYNKITDSDTSPLGCYCFDDIYTLHFSGISARERRMINQINLDPVYHKSKGRDVNTSSSGPILSLTGLEK